jgi:5'-3' exonuclease
MQVHLVDGTYELFRYFYSPGGGHTNEAGEQVGAVRGVLRSMVAMLDDGATHLGVATDHVIESFRNELWADYKDGSGIDPDLRAQFPWLESALEALGVTVWAMVEVEADDALGAAAAVASADPEVERVVICTPDKDLAQCVGGKVVQFDRRAGQFRDAGAVLDKYGVAPESIPDWLALVGDSADGFPGLPGWGAKTAATVLRHYGHLEAIPHAPGQWEVAGVRGVPKLAATLAEQYDRALLFKRLATLDTTVDVGRPAEWCWTGPSPELEQWCRRLDAPEVPAKVARLAAARTD